MDTTGIGAPAGDEGSSAAAEKRPDELGGVLAPVMVGAADEVTVDEAEWMSVPYRGGPVAVSEVIGPASPSAPADQNSDDAGKPDDGAPEPAPAVDVADAANRTKEGTPAAEQRASDTPPEDEPDHGTEAASNDPGDEIERPQFSTSLKLPEDFDWRKLKSRRYGKSLPPLHPSERQTLQESIISRGFVGSRILIDEKNNVIDGNTRLEICMETGIAPVVETIQGLSEDEEQRELEKEGLALSFNRDRRHLEKEDAAKVFEASLDNLLDRRRKDKKLTQQRIAAELGVSVSTVSARERFRQDSAGGTMSKPDARRKYDDELKREAVRLVKEGIAKTDVARQLCMSPKAVERAEKEEKEREAGGAPAKGGKRKKAAAAKPLEPMEDISASNGLPELHRRANEHLKRDDHAYIERLKADAAQARKNVEAVSDIDELQDLSLSYSLTLAFVDQRLRKKLPGASRPNTAGIESDPVLLGIVMAYEQEEVFVALSSGGGGVIDNRGDFLAMYGPPKADEVVRVRVEGFDWKRGLWKLQPQARQTVAPAPGAIAGSDRDDRCRPDTKLAGLKAGPKNKEVTK